MLMMGVNCTSHQSNEGSVININQEKMDVPQKQIEMKNNRQKMCQKYIYCPEIYIKSTKFLEIHLKI